MRARWEREKRKQKDAPAAPKRRRAVKAAEPVAAVEPDGRPKRRRRTAAEMAAVEAEAQAEAAVEAERELKAREVLEAAKAVEDEQRPSLEERAAALFKELPVAEEAGAEAASAAPGAIPQEERRREKGKKRKKGKKSLVDQEAVAQNISRTLASIKGPVTKKGAHRREEGPSFREVEEQKRRDEKEREKTLVRVTEFITVSELANILKVPAKEIVGFAFKELGQMVTINQRLDFDMIELIASAFGFQAAREEEYALAASEEPPKEELGDLKPRAPVVTVIVVLVVAADDAIMPQTIEAISHAKNAGVPLVVAINKIDLPAANVQKVKQDLLTHGVVLEEFGGTTLATPISAKTGQNVQELLDQILLQAELLDLKANPDRRAQGTVLEATLDPGKGPLATILVQNGTLRGGDDFICGQFYGRVRAMYDERGQTVDAAGPSTPVQVLGFEGVPEAGDTFQVMTDAAAARDIAQKRQRLEREAQHRRTGRVKTLEDFMSERAEGGAAALRIIIKADQGGPAEALADALAQLSTPEVKVEVVHRGVGAITD